MPVSLSDIKVSGVVPEQSVDDFGKVTEQMRIFYFIGDFGTYSVLIPKLEATAQRVLTAVRDDAQKIVDILNLQF